MSNPLILGSKRSSSRNTRRHSTGQIPGAEVRGFWKRFNPRMLEVTDLQQTNVIDLHRVNVPELQKIILCRPPNIGCYRPLKIESYRPPEVEQLPGSCFYDPVARCLLESSPPTALKVTRRDNWIEKTIGTLGYGVKA